jgi:hypothetical protein
MPWYIAFAFAGYAALLIWQTTVAIRAGRKAAVVIPFLLIKFSILAVALSYWNADACMMAKRLGWGPVLAAGLLTLREALETLAPLLRNPRHSPAADNLVFAYAVLATVVCPEVVFIFAATVVLTDGCAN